MRPRREELRQRQAAQTEDARLDEITACESFAIGRGVSGDFQHETPRRVIQRGVVGLAMFDPPRVAGFLSFLDHFSQFIQFGTQAVQLFAQFLDGRVAGSELALPIRVMDVGFGVFVFFRRRQRRPLP